MIYTPCGMNSRKPQLQNLGLCAKALGETVRDLQKRHVSFIFAAMQRIQHCGYPVFHRVCNIPGEDVYYIYECTCTCTCKQCGLTIRCSECSCADTLIGAVHNPRTEDYIKAFIYRKCEREYRFCETQFVMNCMEEVNDSDADKFYMMPLRHFKTLLYVIERLGCDDKTPLKGPLD